MIEWYGGLNFSDSLAINLKEHEKKTGESLEDLIIRLLNDFTNEKEERDPIKDIEKWARICLEVEREKEVNKQMDLLRGGNRNG